MAKPLIPVEVIYERLALLDEEGSGALTTRRLAAEIMEYLADLTKISLREGFSRKTAVDCSRALVNLTINHTVMEVRGLREPTLSRKTRAEDRQTEKNFYTSIRWILAGVRADAKA